MLFVIVLLKVGLFYFSLIGPSALFTLFITSFVRNIMKSVQARCKAVAILVKYDAEFKCGYFYELSWSNSHCLSYVCSLPFSRYCSFQVFKHVKTGLLGTRLRFINTRLNSLKKQAIINTVVS